MPGRFRGDRIQYQRTEVSPSRDAYYGHRRRLGIDAKRTESDLFYRWPRFCFHPVRAHGPACAWHREVRGFDGSRYDDLLPRGSATVERKALYHCAWGRLYGAIGTLRPRDPAAKFNPLQNVNRYVTLMMDKGYAVAHTMRSSDRTRGDVSVTLEDGTIVKNNLSSHAGLITSWTKLVRNLISKKQGSMPTRTYFYGHSAGGFLGRLINYQPGANADADGKPIFDGFLLDDAGGGLWLPKLVVNNNDTLFVSDQDRQRFIKQIDITHVLYAGESEDFLQNKRENARLLRAKGLAAKHRMYEILGVSHFDAGQVSRPDLVFQTLDLTGIFDALIDRMDSWVEKDVPPPATKSDMVELGNAHKNGNDKNSAVALPEVACPQGVYYIFPPGVDPGRRGGQETALASFDGVNLEPLDSRGMLVDMNGNGMRDKRETVSQAWQRLGLLKSGQKLSQAVYANCVNAAASKLVKEGLLPKKVGEFYIEQANKTRLPELSQSN